jgi:putative NIF3 family GTP cyclohydrolase 1 type 2
MRCSDLARHFRDVGTWVKPEQDVDGFKAGDPERVVTKVTVAWKPDWETLREAHAWGAEFVVGHESICVNAKNGEDAFEKRFALPSEGPKFSWLEETKLVVYRCHDFLDNQPRVGIRCAWRDGLELGGRIIADEYPYFVTEIEPRSLRDLATHVLEKTRPLGQDGLLICGDLNREVSRVATGTGAITDLVKMRDLGADVAVVTEDYLTHVRMGAHARELDFPFVVANHGVSEEWGVGNLATYIADRFPQLDVKHIPQRCPYTVFTG